MLFMIYWKQYNENVLIMRVNITYKWDEVYYDMAWLPYYIPTLRKSRKVKDYKFKCIIFWQNRFLSKCCSYIQLRLKCNLQKLN